MEKVICNSVDDTCPEHCCHSVPHDPFEDIYGGIEGLCSDIPERCGFRADMPECKCISRIDEARDERNQPKAR